MLCHSVRSCHSLLRSLNLSLVARLKFATGVPLCEYLTSGSLPTFPTKDDFVYTFWHFSTSELNA
jgi:hypothetical protein